MSRLTRACRLSSIPSSETLTRHTPGTNGSCGEGLSSWCVRALHAHACACACVCLSMRARSLTVRVVLTSILCPRRACLRRPCPLLDCQADIRTKKTHSTQTYNSSYRRENNTQVYLPKWGFVLVPAVSSHAVLTAALALRGHAEHRRRRRSGTRRPLCPSRAPSSKGCAALPTQSPAASRLSI